MEIDEFAAIGEWIRKVALGLTAALLSARAFFPSEPDLQAEGGPGLVWSFAILIAAGLALLSMLVSGTLRFRWSWTDAAVILLMVLIGASTSLASDRRTAINLSWQWAAVGVAYLVIRNLPRTRGESMALAGAFVATAVSVAIYGLYQVGVELEWIRAAYRTNPEAVLRKLGIAPDSPGRLLFESRVFGSNEPWSTFALPNSLAGFLVGPLVLFLAAAWRNLRTREGKSSRALALALAALPGLSLLSCLILGKSRSAWIGLAVALAALVWRERRLVRPRVLILTAVAGLVLLGALVAAGLATGRLDTLVLTESTKSLRYRGEYWRGSWQMITHHPGAFWRGVGPGNFGWAYVGYKLPQASEEITDPHNMFLEAWATGGIFAMLALSAALGLALWNLLRRAPGSTPPTADEVTVPTSASESARRQDSANWLVAASGAGLILVVLLGDLNAFADDMFVRWLILGGAWIWAVMLGQVLWRRLPIDASAFGLAALALMINLLAAGGIGIPTVALALWLLIALGLNLRDDRPCGRLRAWGDRGAVFGVAVVWAAMIGVFWGNVMPFWMAEHEVSVAEAALRPPKPDFKKARDAYERAIRLDRYSVRPWLGMVNVEYGAWREAGALSENKMWRTIPILLLKANSRPRNPNAWVLHRHEAQVTRGLLDQIGSGIAPPELIRIRGDVVRAARRATLLYPSNCNLHALLAETSAEISDVSAAVIEADEALRLDRLMPHAEKKLPPAVRKRLEDQLPVWRAAAAGMKPPA